MTRFRPSIVDDPHFLSWILLRYWMATILAVQIVVIVIADYQDASVVLWKERTTLKTLSRTARPLRKQEMSLFIDFFLVVNFSAGFISR